jgi:hypothetical protein
MKPLTIKDLYEECKKQMAKGNADKVIMISDDDEGNGYHYLWYSFSNAKEILINEYEDMSYMLSDNISKIEDTMILG